jgi:hypothetical protein
MLDILGRDFPDAIVATGTALGYGIKEALRFFSASLVKQIPVCVLSVDTWDGAGMEIFS